MKFTIDRDALMTALSLANSVVKKGSPHPALGSVLVDARPDRVRVTASNYDIWIARDADATVIEPGCRAVDFALLYDLSRGFAAGAEIAFAMKDDRLGVRCGRGSGELPTTDPAEWIDLAPLTAEPIVMPGRVLADLFKRTSYAASDDQSRWYLNGCLLQHIQGQLRAVACDTTILALAEADAPLGAKDLPTIIVPTKTAALIAALLEGSDDAVGLAVSDSRMAITLPGLTIDSKLIDGKFPAYEHIIPAPREDCVEVPIGALASAVRRAIATAQDYKRSRIAKLKFGPDLLTVSGSSATARFEETIEVASKIDAELSVDSGALLAQLAAIGGRADSALFHVYGPKDPFRMSVDSDPSSVWVVAPMLG